MNSDELAEFLLKLLEAHGPSVTPHNGWLVPNGEFPALRGTWFPADAERRVGELSVQVLLADERVIHDRFAGPGDNAEGQRFALETFQHSMLHVLLAALWDCVVEDQVTIETWSWSGRDFTVYSGLFFARFWGMDHFAYPDHLYPRIEAALKERQFSDEIHWLQVFYCNNGKAKGQPTVEVLLDDAPWPALAAAIQDANWPASDRYYWLRQFTILKPTSQ